MTIAVNRRERLLLQEGERSRRGEAEVSALQQEINRHTMLEHELTVAKQAAESAVMAKGEFLATMSHEIRTPLNGIVPMLDLLMHSRLPADQRELVRTAFSSSQQLLRIVDDILDYSKLEADKLDLETTTFNLRELLESVITLMERPAEAKGLQPEAATRAGCAPAGARRPDAPAPGAQQPDQQCDQVHRTRQRDAAREAPGRNRAQHQLRFEVSDTGIGIDAGRAGTPVPGLQPGRCIDHPPVRRHRAGIGDLQAHRRP